MPYSQPTATASQLIDINGDGLDDWVYSDGSTIHVLLNIGHGWQSSPSSNWDISTSTLYLAQSSPAVYYDHGIRFMDINGDGPGFVRTPLVDKQIPEQAKELGISEAEVVRNIMLKDTVDGEFTTVEDVAEAALFCAAFQSNALTGQSLVVSHGWFMQ
jgi:hypothetical protein